MKRRDFLKYASSLAVVMANGRILRAGEPGLQPWLPGDVALRFVVASDGHYGQPNTDYENYYKTLVDRINEEHAGNPFSFCMINGDIIHDEKSFYPAAKKALDRLRLKYYVSQGNHDKVTGAEWQTIWDIPVNYDFKVGENSFLIATTSNENGDYLCPDTAWVESKLKEHASQKNVFIFLHINSGKLTKNAVDCPALFEVFGRHKNIKAVFNGHDHDQEDIKKKNGIPFIFDAHFGGNWGTAYRGFRVVELMKDNSVVTYIMNPVQKINNASI